MFLFIFLHQTDHHRKTGNGNIRALVTDDFKNRIEALIDELVEIEGFTQFRAHLLDFIESLLGHTYGHCFSFGHPITVYSN